MGGCGAGEIKEVSVHSDADTVYFGLGWSNGGNHLGVCDFSTLGDGCIYPRKENNSEPPTGENVVPREETIKVNPNGGKQGRIPEK